MVRVSKYPQFRDQPFPSPQSLYNEGGIKEVLATELEKAALLKDLGINVNFAPVADVSTDPSDFINARSLGKPAPETARCIGSVVNAMKGEGMGTVLKHFPGYGTNRDTHTGVAIDERPFETFQESDFLPFQAGIEAGAGCILISHTIVKSMDDQNPASLSPAVHDILRQQLGFNGVAITDDLDMDAIADYAEEGEAAVAAVLAGNDMLITSDYARQIPQVVEAVRNGVIPGNLIDQAALRVLLWKMELGILQP